MISRKQNQIQNIEERYKGYSFKILGESGNFQSIDHQDDNPNGPQKCKNLIFLAIEGWILFVSGVHEEAQEEDLYDSFSKYGAIKNLHLNLDRRTGYVKGYAMVEYEHFKESQKALKEMNGADILGQQVKVDWAFKKPQRKIKK